MNDNQNLNASKILSNFTIFFLFFFLTVLFTFPLFFRLNTSLFYFNNPGDNFGAIWDIWWMKHTWLNNLPHRYIPILATPFGVDLGMTIPSTWGSDPPIFQHPDK